MTDQVTDEQSDSDTGDLPGRSHTSTSHPLALELRISKLEDHLKGLRDECRELRGQASDAMHRGADAVAIATEVKIAILGDQEARAKWESLRNNTTPNIPEPPRGLLELANSTFDNARILATSIEMKLADGLKFSHRLEAFFGPMLQGKNPPMDGEQIASKAYVDDALRRLSTTLREMITNSLVGLSNSRVDTAIEMTGALLTLVNDAPTVEGRIRLLADRLSHVFHRERLREQAEAIERNRPSRLEALRIALTGRGGRS